MIHDTFNNLNQQKKEHILSAAKSEFILKGFEHAKVQSICKNADIPRSAFYRYFDSLEDCLEALFENMRTEKIFKFKTLLADHQKDLLLISLNMLEDILEDEETYLFMSSMLRSQLRNLPMVKEMRVPQIPELDEKVQVIRSSLMKVVRGLAEEHYIFHKPKDECIKEYLIFIEMLKKGMNNY